MRSVWFFILGCLLNSSQAFRRLIGGKQPLTTEEYNSETFNVLVEQATRECNLQNKDLFWYKAETIFDATKQVVEGMSYEFKLRLRPTTCQKSWILQKESKQVNSSCIVSEDEVTGICSVNVWHRPWIEDGTKVTIKNFWRVAPISKTFSEIYTPVQPDEVETEVNKLNFQNISAVLYKYDQVLSGYNENEKENTNRMLSVRLLGTMCTRTDDPEANYALKNETCYTELSGEALVCNVPLKSEANRSNASTTSCFKTPHMASKSMWRSSRYKDLVSPTCYPQNYEKALNVQPIKIVAKSNIRPLTDDEIRGLHFQELLKLAVRAYNQMSNSAYMFNQYDVTNVKLEVEPSPVYTFKLTLQATTCLKNQDYLENATKFETDCSSYQQNQPLQQCHVTVTPMGGQPNPLRWTRLAACKAVTNKPIILGAPVSLSEGERKSSEFQSILDRIATHYNTHANSMYDYAVTKCKNVKFQLIGTKLYTMEVTMVAVGMKNQPIDPGFSKYHKFYRHCHVTVLEHSLDKTEEINITNCWDSTELTKPIDGLWERLSTQHITSSEMTETINKCVAVYNQLSVGSPPMLRDFVDNVYKLTVKYKDMYTFDLHLKGTNPTDKRIKCKVVSPRTQSEANPEGVYVYNCQQKPSPGRNLLIGGPKRLDQDALQSEDFQNDLISIIKEFNEANNDTFYHRLLTVVNATSQVVQGVKIVISAHFQKTSCQKVKDEQLHNLEKHLLCGQLNTTHTKLCKISIWKRPWLSKDIVNIQYCEPTKQMSVSSVQPVMSKPFWSSTVQDLADRALMVFNLYRNISVLYDIQYVMNFTKTASKPVRYEFDLLLRPTKCIKWTEMEFFGNKHHKHCTNLTKMKVAKCKVTVTMDKSGALNTLKLDECEHFNKRAIENVRPMTAKETANPDFNEIVNKSVLLFNAGVHSFQWYKLFLADRPNYEYVGGKQIQFQLYMLPEKCLQKNAEGLPEANKNAVCRHDQPEHLVQCEVRYWEPEWNTRHKLWDLERCSLIPIEGNADNAKDRETKTTDNVKCVESLLERFVQLFNEQNNISRPYGHPVADHIEEQVVPGKRLTFDLYLKPGDQTNQCGSTDGNAVCNNSDHFYSCKASVWMRGWSHTEMLDLKDCLRVEQIWVKQFEADRQQALIEMQYKALDLYNNQLSESFIFGDAKVMNVSEKRDFGIKTSFELSMRAVACQKKPGIPSCNVDTNEIRAQCFVIVWQQPWRTPVETIQLQNCREHFTDQWKEGARPLSDEEQSSEDFQMTVNKVARLYTSEVPIIYGVESIQNATVHVSDKHRNISFQLTLHPVGCNQSLPGAEDLRCINWKEQEKVCCEAQISESQWPAYMKYFSLSNCRTLWNSEAERRLTEEEMQSAWFRKTLESAWKIQESILPGNNMYAVVEVTNATIETDVDQIIKYTMELQMTECPKDMEGVRFVDTTSRECPIKENAAQNTCSVVIKRMAEGRSHTQLRCRA